MDAILEGAQQLAESTDLEVVAAFEGLQLEL
jgi:hypothetical protein